MALMNAAGADFSASYWELRDQVFSAENMYSRLYSFALEHQYEQMLRALPYAKRAHEGQTRYPAPGVMDLVPYFIHPLMLCFQARAMGLVEEELLVSLLLHDVCEDCGIDPSELPFSDEVTETVRLVTKDKARIRELGKKRGLSEYYAGIRTSQRAMLVKCIDRCHNISTMALVFPVEKIAAYIKETEYYVIPMLDRIRQDDDELRDAAFMLRYQLRSMMESLKAMLFKEA